MRWVTFEDTSLDSSPEMTLKSVDWSWLVEGDDSPLHPATQTRLWKQWT